MKKVLIIFFSAAFFTLSLFNTVLAQDSTTFDKATVQEITDNGDSFLIKAQLNKSNKVIDIIINKDGFSAPELTKYSVGTKIIVSESVFDGVTTYSHQDIYRLDILFWLGVFFLILTIIIVGKRGIGSLVGLAITFAILVLWIAPQIIAGHDPLLISSIGSFAIATVSILIAHGFRKRTYIALGSVLITLCIAIGIGVISVTLSKLLGIGSEEAAFLTININESIDLRGILLGAIIIGTLGVLDDVATAQTATVEEIHKANASYSFLELFKRGMSVGQEHIISLVNTLVLAYVGAAFPIFLILTTNSIEPLWVTLNAEFVAEEIVRTIVGSITLVLAVPISTFLAAKIYSDKK